MIGDMQEERIIILILRKAMILIRITQRRERGKSRMIRHGNQVDLSSEK